MALEYRNELKYVVSSRQIAILRNRIRPLMALDAHTGTKGKYTIRSVYFDDYRNICYLENADGTSPREKFRIRIYNADEKVIRLELKRKEEGTIPRLLHPGNNFIISHQTQTLLHMPARFC